MAWWGRGVSAFQEERKHAGTFLERFLQHWRNESCWGRERHQGYGEIPGLALVKFFFTGRQLTSSSGG
jgi:hypothetical protein